MPIRFVGNQAVYAANETLPGGLSACSFQIWLRREDAVSPGGGVLFGKEFTTPFCLLPMGGTTDLTCRIQFSTASWVDFASVVLRVGVDYHIVGTYEAGRVRVYLNGLSVYDRQNANVPLGVANHRWKVGPASGTASIVLGDAWFWRDRVLTLQEIQSLRDRVLDPADVDLGSRLLGWSLDGPAGTTVALGSAGVSGGRAASAVVGAPTYVATDFQYVSPARVRRAYVGGSGKTLVVTFEATSGAATTIASQAAHPTVRLNGGAAVDLSSPGCLRTSGYLFYPLPFSVGPGDLLTYSAADGWVAAAAGPVSQVVDGVADLNEIGGDMLPEEPPGPRHMNLGMNIRGPEYFDPLPVYANLMKQAHSGFATVSGTPVYTLDANGYLASLSGGTVGTLVCDRVSSGIGNPDKGHPNLPAGQVTLLWDGSAEVSLRGEGGVNSLTQVSYDRTGAADNRRVYAHSFSSGKWSAYVQAVFHGADARNVRIYGPGVDPSRASRFHPEFLSRLAGARAIRLLDCLDINNSSISDASMFTPRSRRSYGTRSNSPITLSRSIASVGPYAPSGPNPLSPNNQHTTFTVTTTVDHGYTTGQVIKFSTPFAGVPCADGSNFTVPRDHISIVQVLSPTSFAAALYTGTAKVISGTVARTGTVVREVLQQMPLEDCAELCNEVAADCWALVPHALDDDGVAFMVDKLATNLAPGRKLYLEYSNECWNFGLSFLQTSYCQMMGILEGLTGRQWYAKRAGQVHAIGLARWLAAGRSGSDFVRVFGSQSADSSVTSSIVSYCTANGLPIDALAVAPYFDTSPGGPAVVYDAMDTDQLMDASALAVADYPLAEVAPHKPILHAAFPNARLVCYEAALQRGVTTATDTSTLSRRVMDWSLHPRIRGQLTRFLLNIQEAGYDLLCYFQLNMYRTGSAWGVYAQGYFQESGTGDGSDGKFDNRTDYTAMMQLVSPLGLGMRDWYEAMAPPPAPPPPPAPRAARPARIIPSQMRARRLRR